MLRKVFLAAAILSFIVLAANPRPANEAKAIAPEPPGPSVSDQATVGANLLYNPALDFDYYFRPTNHLVARGWYEWFWAEAGHIPEFIDGGHPYHNACYPPEPDGKCEVANVKHNGSQGYILMNGAFIAGIYQSVSVVPCASYKFEAWDRNDSTEYNPKVGIDPTGQVLPEYVPPDGDSLPWNCGPNENLKCPNPGLHEPWDLPPNILWSNPVNPPAYTWTPISATAEALSTTISVWTYAAPDRPGSQSAYWDYTSLYQVTPQTLLPDGRVPGPDGRITGLTTTPQATTAQIQWTTSQPAFSQVLYRVQSTGTPYTGTAILAPRIYLPIVARGWGNVSEYTFKTIPTTNAATNQSVTLTGLEASKTYEYVAISRWFSGSACIPSASATGVFTTTASASLGPVTESQPGQPARADSSRP